MTTRAGAAALKSAEWCLHICAGLGACIPCAESLTTNRMHLSPADRVAGVHALRQLTRDCPRASGTHIDAQGLANRGLATRAADPLSSLRRIDVGIADYSAVLKW